MVDMSKLPENIQKLIVNEYLGKNVTPTGLIMKHMITSRDRASENAYKDATKIMPRLTRGEFCRIQNQKSAWYHRQYPWNMLGDWNRVMLIHGDPNYFKGLIASVRDPHYFNREGSADFVDLRDLKHFKCLMDFRRV